MAHRKSRPYLWVCRDCYKDKVGKEPLFRPDFYPIIGICRICKRGNQMLKQPSGDYYCRKCYQIKTGKEPSRRYEMMSGCDGCKDDIFTLRETWSWDPFEKEREELWKEEESESYGKTNRVFDGMIAIGPKNVIFGPTKCPECGNNEKSGPDRLIRDKYEKDAGFFGNLEMRCHCNKCGWKMKFEWEAPPEKRRMEIWYPFVNLKSVYEVLGITLSE